MAKHLTEIYELNCQVEIFLVHENTWLQGIVIKYEPPGIWVQTVDGGSWFVTNTRRIRFVHPDQSQN